MCDLTGDISAYRELSRNDPLEKHHYVDMLKQRNTIVD